MDILDQLKVFGYAIQPSAIDEVTCARYADALDAIEKRKRADRTVLDSGVQVVVHNLHVEEPNIFLGLLDESPVFPVIQKVLSNGQQIILNGLVASRSLKVDDSKVNGDQWPTHIDSRMPKPDFHHTESIVGSICLDDFTVENGATRIWPYTHFSGMRPPLNIDSHQLPGAVPMIAKRGSIVYWLGQTWHAISKNLSGQRRWCIVCHYTYWWTKPSYDFTQCGPDIYGRLTPRQKSLLGFNSRPPISPDIRKYTVTKADELPEDYEAAMRSDYSVGKSAATAHTSDYKN